MKSVATPIINNFESAEQIVWGFKDPRALLTMPFWHAAIPGLEFVGTYRHPYLVAKSLNSRDQMPNGLCSVGTVGLRTIGNY